MRAYQSWISLVVVALGVAASSTGRAAGTLAPRGSGEQPMAIRDHHVNVVISNGFAKTEVVQTFVNPNQGATEALYTFPLPRSASLSEMSITTGETTITGEVLPKARAQTLYEEEREQGHQAGLAQKDGYQAMEFLVAPMVPGQDATVRFVYYQPLSIDSGVGRYVYPLEEGGTDEQAQSFWLRNDEVDGTFSVHLTLDSAWPITDLRVPGFPAANTQSAGKGRHVVELVDANAGLNQDFVLYYRLQEDLPGRVEVVPYRDRADAPGTFMMVVTPGVDLQPITGGSDYLFVLDTSGSMQDKIGTLSQAVERAVQEFQSHDRFRIVAFSDSAHELTSGWVDATPENVREYASRVKSLRADGGTNLYDGLDLALRQLDDDRATSLVLLTDAVANRGELDPQRFGTLMKKHDIRVFGFLLGNSGNWPLMQLLAEGSGGFYERVSNADDILGQLMLAKNKVRHEALHDLAIEFSGTDVFELTHVPEKIYRGQQLVFFGRYRESGKASVKLEARLTGKDRVYRTSFVLPEQAPDHPEIERLWALAQVERLGFLRDTGQLVGAEADHAIRELGVAYQLVTDETSMVVARDEAFERHGVKRNNRARVAREHDAQARRAAAPVQNHRVDESDPAFGGRAPGVGGGGALGPFEVLLMLLVLGGVGTSMLRRRRIGHGH